MGKKRKRNKEVDPDRAVDASPAPEEGEQDPLGAMELLSKSLRIYIDNFGIIAVFGFICFLPIEILAVAFQSSETDPFKAWLEEQQIQAIPYILIGTLAFVVVIRATANAMNGEATDFRSVWKASAPRYLSTVPTTIAQEMVVTALLLLLVIPGLIGMIYTSFALQVPSLRQETGFHALRHSKALVEGNFWKVTAYYVFLGGGAEAMLLGVHTLVDLIPNPYVAVPIATFGQVLALFATVAFTVLYVDLERTRFE